MRKVAGIVIALLCVLFVACDNHCYVPQKSMLGIAFVDSTTLKPLGMNYIGIQGVGSDSIITTGQQASEIFVPLKQNAPQTDFVLAFSRTIEGVEVITYCHLNVSYNAYPQLVNPECGCVMFYELESATCTNAETGEVLNMELYNTNVVNIERDVHLKIHL